MAGNGTEEDKLEARIEIDVYEALQHAVGSKWTQFIPRKVFHICGSTYQRSDSS